MKTLFLAFAFVFGALAADMEQTVSVRLGVESGAGLTEVVSGLEEGAGELQGDRGCLNGASSCEDAFRLKAATGAARPGQGMRLGIEGSSVAAQVAVRFNGEELLSRTNVQLPADFVLPAVSAEGRLSVFVEVDGKDLGFNFDVAEAGKLAGGARSAIATTPKIRFFANVAEEGNWEVITGSGTGGRLVRTSTYCMLPGLTVAQCPVVFRVFGYTDRARRGETVYTVVEGSGLASSIGVTINGRVRGAWSNVWLPVLVPQTVSLSPFDDNIYAFVVLNGRYTERRLPVGTRPF